MTPNHIVIYCGLLLSISAFSVDIMLPAFGKIADDLSADYSQIQLTIPIFLAAIGFGQIFTGPLSDRFGRKPVLMGGLFVFSIGSIICLFAGNAHTLLIGRAIQGIGASGGPVVGRAVLRDLFSGRQLASNLALASMVFAFGPIVAPLAGAGLLVVGNWQMVFGAILGFGLFLLLIGIMALPETNHKKDENAISPKKLWNSTLTVLGHRQSRFYFLLQTPIMITMLLILMSIPRLYRDEFGIEGTLFAILFALHGIGIIVGQSLNRFVIAKHGPQTALMLGAIISSATAILMMTLFLFGLLNAYVLSFTLILFAMGFLTMSANAIALTLDPHGSIAGFVSSFTESVARIFASTLAGIAIMIIASELHRFLLIFLASTLVALGLTIWGQRRISTDEVV